MGIGVWVDSVEGGRGRGGSDGVVLGVVVFLVGELPLFFLFGLLVLVVGLDLFWEVGRMKEPGRFAFLPLVFDTFFSASIIRPRVLIGPEDPFFICFPLFPNVAKMND